MVLTSLSKAVLIRHEEGDLILTFCDLCDIMGYVGSVALKVVPARHLKLRKLRRNGG